MAPAADGWMMDGAAGGRGAWRRGGAARSKKKTHLVPGDTSGLMLLLVATSWFCSAAESSLSLPAAVAGIASSSSLVWPLPSQMDSFGPRDLVISPNVTIVLENALSHTPLMERGLARFEALLRKQEASSAAGGGGYGGRGFRLPGSAHQGSTVVEVVTIRLPLPISNTEHLGLSTDYSYTLDIGGAAAPVTITANSSFGALCGLETLAQLAHDGRLGRVHIVDAPQYPHRGLMLDTGRRFHPVSLVKNFLDGCRFAVQSRLFPQLTANLTGIQAGHYTQEQVKELVQYAKDRGIRVIPEFDLPGHTGGWLPLVGSTAVQFCGSFPAHEERPQLYHDPANATLKVVISLLKEMSTLFIDEYFNIGSDETFAFANSAGPNCSGSNAAGLEQAVADHVRSVWGRRVMGWDALKTTGNQIGHGPERKGGLSDTAKVYWHGAPSSETIVGGGIDWVAASKGHSYLDHGTPPSGFWWDIREGNKKNLNGTETKSLLSTGLLGGEVCHWTDKYCYIFECLTTWHDKFTAAYNISSYMYPPSQDTVFAESVSGKIWPRAAVAAGSYWHFTNATWASLTPQFEFITGVLVSRGVDACPTNCTCTELARCGVPYPGAPPPAPRPIPPPGPPAPPHPPTPTTATYSRPCDNTDAHQHIQFVPVTPATSEAGTPVIGRLRNSQGLCVDSQGWTKHAPLGFVPCNNTGSKSDGQLWYHGADGTLSQPPTLNRVGERSYCLDSFGQRGGKWEVGIFPCSHDAKETWVVSNHSLKDGYDGRCLSDAPSQVLPLKLDDEIRTNVNDESAQGGAACTNIDDCFLGGECKAGVCDCDAWRTAANCSQINMLPVGESGPQVYPESSWSSWGAQVIYWNDKYHLFSSRFSNRCGLNSWWCNSEVIHAESDTPDGIFQTEGAPVVLPFAHNPAVGVANDGTLVIFHIGSGTTPRSKQGNCSGGISGLDTNQTRAWCAASLLQATEAPRAGQKWNAPNIAFSNSPRGPWTQLNGGDSWGADNPAPIFLENGTVLLYVKMACNETINPRSAACYQYGLLQAQHWRGPWTFVRMIEVFGEDVAAWQDQRGYFHMLLQGGPYKGTASAYLRNCVGHYHLATSKDGLEWTMYCHATLVPRHWPSYPLTNGSIVKVKRRERHYVLLGPNKQPLWLYNGVAGQEYIKEVGQDHTYSAAQAFNSRSDQQWHELDADRLKTDDIPATHPVDQHINGHGRAMSGKWRFI